MIRDEFSDDGVRLLIPTPVGMIRFGGLLGDALGPNPHARGDDPLGLRISDILRI